MKVKIDRKEKTVDAKKVRIETEDYIFDFSVCQATGKLQINKVDGKEFSSIEICPRYANEIEIK